MMHLDDAMSKALRSLLGDDWRERLRAAVAQAMSPPPQPTKRALTDAQRDARRRSMLAINAARAAAKTAHDAAPVSPAVKAIATRKANEAARAAVDMTDPALNAAEAHEARERLAKGQGAMELREWFGGGLGWWQAWCERERARP